MTHTNDFMAEFDFVTSQLDRVAVACLVEELVSLRERQGRLFVLGVGGSAANAIHVVSDLRKLASVEAYSFDNLAELTARVNDSETGWHELFRDWLRLNRLSSNDALLVLSIGGGQITASFNLAHALTYAKYLAKAKVFSITGRKDGYAAERSDIAIVIPENKYTTPICEAMQMVIMHCVVSHPKLQVNAFKWS